MQPSSGASSTARFMMSATLMPMRMLALHKVLRPERADTFTTPMHRHEACHCFISIAENMPASRPAAGNAHRHRRRHETGLITPVCRREAKASRLVATPLRRRADDDGAGGGLRQAVGSWRRNNVSHAARPSIGLDRLPALMRPPRLRQSEATLSSTRRLRAAPMKCLSSSGATNCPLLATSALMLSS